MIFPLYRVKSKINSKTWKTKRYLNIGKRIKKIREFIDGYIDFNQWKNDSINEVIHSNYSKYDNMTRKLIMNDLMNDLFDKVIRVVDKNHSIFMTDQEIRSSVQIKFKNHVSYKVTKNPNANFWKIVYDSWCKDISKNVNKPYDLTTHQKVPVSKRAKNNTTSNVRDFHARFSALSALRNPIKLKLWNCSHRHHSEKLFIEDQ